MGTARLSQDIRRANKSGVSPKPERERQFVVCRYELLGILCHVRGAQKGMGSVKSPLPMHCFQCLLCRLKASTWKYAVPFGPYNN